MTTVHILGTIGAFAVLIYVLILGWVVGTRRIDQGEELAKKTMLCFDIVQLLFKLNLIRFKQGMYRSATVRPRQHWIHPMQRRRSKRL